jgi:GNAT superfamily N-acetyltransferase
VVGFALVGPAQDPAGAGQLYAINVDPDHWGTGAGRALLAAAQAELVRLGYREAVLWVLPGNACARRFYEVAGCEVRVPGSLTERERNGEPAECPAQRLRPEWAESEEAEQPGTAAGRPSGSSAPRADPSPPSPSH